MGGREDWPGMECAVPGAYADHRSPHDSAVNSQADHVVPPADVQLCNHVRYLNCGYRFCFQLAGQCSFFFFFSFSFSERQNVHVFDGVGHRCASFGVS